MLYVLVNYNFTPDWLREYTDDFLIYDRSDSKEYLKDFDQGKIVYTKNIGNVDYDKLGYLIDNYDSLPHAFVWGKTNLFKYISHDEFDKVKRNERFTPLLTQKHPQVIDNFGVLSFYANGMYHERNGEWTGDWFKDMDWKYFKSFNAFAQHFGVKVGGYIPFPPGGNFILTRETVHKYSVDLYKEMRDMLDYAQLPAEAHFCERLYYLLWRS